MYHCDPFLYELEALTMLDHIQIVFDHIQIIMYSLTIYIWWYFMICSEPFLFTWYK